MTNRVKWTSWLLFCLLAKPTFVLAWVHVAQEDETLEQLAVRYYGAAKNAIVIRAANGFKHPDNGRLTAGERIEIPENDFYRITEDDESWDNIAERFLGSAERRAIFAKLNGFEEDQLPPVGTIIKVPYHVLHIFNQNETIRSVARLYYDKQISPTWLQDYNFTKKKKFTRGTPIIVPLMELEIREEERNRIDELRRNRSSASDKAKQESARIAIERLKEAFSEGRYVNMVAIAAGLLGNVELTVPQEITIQNYLAFSYIALGEKQLAIEAFKRALSLQPVMELSPITTSPKILEVFNEARKQTTVKATSDGGTAAPNPTN